MLVGMLVGMQKPNCDLMFSFKSVLTYKSVLNHQVVYEKNRRMFFMILPKIDCAFCVTIIAYTMVLRIIYYGNISDIKFIILL